MLQLLKLVITLCMKLPLFCHTNSGQLFCDCPRPRPLFGGKSAKGSKVVLTLQLPQLAENSDTWSALLDDKELQ